MARGGQAGGARGRSPSDLTLVSRPCSRVPEHSPTGDTRAWTGGAEDACARAFGGYDAPSPEPFTLARGFSGLNSQQSLSGSETCISVTRPRGVGSRSVLDPRSTDRPASGGPRRARQCRAGGRVAGGAGPTAPVAGLWLTLAPGVGLRPVLSVVRSRDLYSRKPEAGSRASLGLVSEGVSVVRVAGGSGDPELTQASRRPRLCSSKGADGVQGPRSGVLLGCGPLTLNPTFLSRVH